MLILVALLALAAPPADRIAARDFPSVFQAWGAATNLPNEDPLRTVARHDLYFTVPEAFRLRWDGPYIGIARSFAPETLAPAQAMRRRLLELNPNIVTLCEIRYRDAPSSYLPEDHPWWLREDGRRVVGWEEGNHYVLDFANPEFQDLVAAQAKAVVDSGAFDGVMLDWWSDDPDRLALIEKVREAIGPDALIIANANDRQTPETAPYINGYFMECYRTSTAEDWQRIEETLRWAEANLREPRINGVEFWYQESRQDLNLMRAVTTMVLTMSDGYALFSDPNPLPTPDHLHDWYPFWDEPLGHPEDKGVRRADGAWQREFSRGTAVYNSIGNETVDVHFRQTHRRASTGEQARSFRLDPADGDLFLRL